MLDIRLLQALRLRRDYAKLKAFVPTTAIDVQTKVLLDVFGEYYAKFQDHEFIDYETFISWFETFKFPDMQPDMKAVYRTLIRRALCEEVESTTDAILSELHELRLMHTMRTICAKWDDGELQHSPDDLFKAALERYKLDRGVSDDAWVRPDIGDLLAEEMSREGLPWPLLPLQQTMRPARPGDFLIVAARPGKGKTTWVAQLATHWAPHVPSGKVVVWLNNEGPGKRIYLRLYRAALGMRLTEMKVLVDNGTIHDAYHAKVGGPDKVRVLDIHGMNTAQVDALLERHNPGVIVFDMLDNIRWAGAMQPRQDLIAEELYQWGRERCVKYDCVGLATSQINGEGDGLLYPSMKMLKDSATTKQGACDGIIMLGASNDPGLDNVRGLSVQKSKFGMDGCPQNPRCEIIIDPDTSRYKTLGEDTGIQPQPIAQPGGDDGSQLGLPA